MGNTCAGNSQSSRIQPDSHFSKKLYLSDYQLENNSIKICKQQHISISLHPEVSYSESTKSTEKFELSYKNKILKMVREEQIDNILKSLPPIDDYIQNIVKELLKAKVAIDDCITNESQFEFLKV